jgi:hypothetical protein
MLAKIGKYFLNIAIWVDQGAAVVFLGGDPDETISSRLGKLKRKFGGRIPWSRPFAKIIDWGLDKIDPGHSIDAIEDDEGENGIR